MSILEPKLEYADFWPRFGATMIDTILWCVFMCPVLYFVYGAAYFDPSRSGMFAGPTDFLLSIVFPAVSAILFWKNRKATPGKILLKLSVVDARTGNALSLKQSVVRYFAYIVSMIPLCAGFLWILFDLRKQAWHDKIAGSVVVREK